MKNWIHINNFKEVCTGYNKKEALEESNRCLQCKLPICVSGCPIKVDIPKFIYYIKNDDLDNAYKTIFKYNIFPEICGRVCPYEKQCEYKCILKNKTKSINIGKLERYVADNVSSIYSFSLLKKKMKKYKKIAVIGSGPASLTVAINSVINGYNVTIYEALNEIGGVLNYGIPNFRLPRRIINLIKKKIDYLGIKIVYNYVVGKLETLDNLSLRNDAVFVGTGSGVPLFLNIKGEHLKNIYSANEYLTKINLMKAYNMKYDTKIDIEKNVIVIGGGNVAIDAARSAIRLGSKNVTIIYRKSRENMPARKEDIENAAKEGVSFIFMSKPISFIENQNNKGFVEYTEFIRTNIKYDINRCKDKIFLEDIKNSNFRIRSDMVIIAIGTKKNNLVFNNSKMISITSENSIDINENMQYKNTNIFIGGDIITGTETVISAINHGIKASIGIDYYLKNN